MKYVVEIISCTSEGGRTLTGGRTEVIKHLSSKEQAVKVSEYIDKLVKEN